jgi:hypothetical protein
MYLSMMRGRFNNNARSQEGAKIGGHVGAQLAIVERCGSEHKSPSRAQIIFQMLVLCLLLMLLINYKGAAGLNKIRQALTVGRPSVPTLPIGSRRQYDGIPRRCGLRKDRLATARFRRADQRGTAHQLVPYALAQAL